MLQCLGEQWEELVKSATLTLWQYNTITLYKVLADFTHCTLIRLCAISWCWNTLQTEQQLSVEHSWILWINLPVWNKKWHLMQWFKNFIQLHSIIQPVGNCINVQFLQSNKNNSSLLFYLPPYVCWQPFSIRQQPPPLQALERLFPFRSRSLCFSINHSINRNFSVSWPT